MKNHIAAMMAMPAMFAAPSRRTYRDIPENFDRMGQMGMGQQMGWPVAQQQVWPAGAMPQGGQMMGWPGGAPQGFGGGGLAQGFAGFNTQNLNDVVGNGACGSVACCPVEQPTRAYERVVGLPRVCIDGCECETIETTVCGAFTLTGLYIAPKVAHFLSITRLQVGCNNILVNCDPIPAELFSCCEIDDNVITSPTVEANSPICLEVENESQKEIEFKGALKGLLCTTC